MNWFKRKKAPAENADLVSVMDFATGEVTRIPARELAPNMVQAQVEGVEGTVWIDVTQTQQGEYKHDSFSEEIRETLRTIQTSVEEFYPLTLEAWEDGFRRDANAESEIAMWLYLANLYRELTASGVLTEPQRRDTFKILLACLNSPREHVLKIAPPDALSTDEANAIIARFHRS